MISAALKFWCVYCCFTGQPHSHPTHPDYIPSVFLAENKLFSHKRSEQDMSRFHRCMERSAKQAKCQMKETEEENRERKERLRAGKKDFRKKRKDIKSKEVPTEGKRNGTAENPRGRNAY